MNTEQSIEELQIKVAYLESQHDELNAVVVQLQEENRQLVEALKDLKQHVQSAQPSLLADLSDETPPPHY